MVLALCSFFAAKRNCFARLERITGYFYNLYAQAFLFGKHAAKQRLKR